MPYKDHSEVLEAWRRGKQVCENPPQYDHAAFKRAEADLLGILRHERRQQALARRNEFWSTFWRYFWTAQLIAGLANGVRGIVYAAKDPQMVWLDIPLMAALGFATVIPIAALLAAGMAGADRFRQRRLSRLPDQQTARTTE